jgi:hypothetical protein
MVLLLSSNERTTRTQTSKKLGNKINKNNREKEEW